MPLFTSELNRIADSIVASAVTIRLHTAAPTRRLSDHRAHYSRRNGL